MSKAVQGAVVEQVLLDREVEIEGRLLEHDPHLPQALQHLLADVHAEDADCSLGLSIEAGCEREQRGFPSAIQPKQYRKVPRRDRKRNVFQHPARPKTVSEPFDDQGRHIAHESLTGGRRHPRAAGRRERI
jgi:hypothetical protein